MSQDLWKKAYGELDEKDRALLETHGSQFAEQNETLISQIQLDKRKSECTRMMGRLTKQAVKDATFKIIGFIDGMKELIGPIAELEPHAAMAWQGISLLLPVSTQIGSLSPSCLNHDQVHSEGEEPNRSHACRSRACDLSPWVL